METDDSDSTPPPDNGEVCVGDADRADIPFHVAIIMDGNGRWARSRGLDVTAGHRAGFANIEPVWEMFADRGVREATLFAFSTENWSRPAEEVDALMSLLSEEIRAGADRFNQKRVRLRHLGELDGLSDEVRRKIGEAESATANNTALTLNVAFNYGGRQDIVQAVRAIVRSGASADEIDESTVSRHLYTAGGTDPDLVIRTGGEFRISNFLLWQNAYAEFHSTETLWPDFGVRDVEAALAAYASRERRFGRRGDVRSEVVA